MIGLEGLTPELATDLITLVNSLQKLTKSAKVKYSVKNKTTGDIYTMVCFDMTEILLRKLKEDA